MTSVDYIQHDLRRVAGLLQIGITRVPRQEMSEDDVLLRTIYNDILTLSGNIKKRIEKEKKYERVSINQV